jgi:phytanoyl-CoA hydroxylase
VSATDRERDAYRADGFFVRPGALPPEACEALCGRLSEVIERDALARSSGPGPVPGFFEVFRRSAHDASVFWDLSRGGPAGLRPAEWERFVMRVGHGLHAADDRFREAALGPAVGGTLAALVGGRPCVAQSAVVYKQPRSEAVQFGLHQDSWYLTTEPESLALAFVALDDMDPERGCLEVVPGSHRGGLLARLRLGARGFEPVGRDPRVEDRPTLPLVMRRGDAAFIAGRTLHASGPNRALLPRRALIVHAFDASSRLCENTWLQPPAGGFTPLPGSTST